MTQRIKVSAAFAWLLFGTLGSAAAMAADKPLFTCADGAKTSAQHLCADHGGVKRAVPAGAGTAKNASKPIDTTAGLTPPAKTKTKTSATVASKSTTKKTASKATGGPTAKCNDGALYYSMEHKGACLSHGGVDKWYIW